jgi:hypothetical protein
MIQQNPSYNRSTISFHQGAALLRLADTYPTLLDVILEQVQNALDVNVKANRVWIDINYRTRSCIVRDNGLGAGEAEFNPALQSICDPGRKARNEDPTGENPMGQFSIGLISWLGKCVRCTFTSCRHPKVQGYIEWTFVTKELAEQRGDLSIPMRRRTELTFGTAGRGQQHVDWRSEFYMHDLTKDVTISRVEMGGLVTAILDRFSIPMRKNKVVINVKITDEAGKLEERPNVQAPRFSGKKLPEIVIENDQGGKTWFRLYLAQKARSGRKEKIVMGTSRDDYRFPVDYFLRAQHPLSAPVVEALTSGIFEGEIVSQRAELNPDRKSFIKNDNVRLGLCIAIEEWFKLHGSKLLEEVKEERRDERYQLLGLRSLNFLEHLLRDSPLLMGVINSFKRGTIGIGHTEPEKILGTQDSTAISVDGKGGGNHTPSDEPSDRERGKPEAEKPKHHPGTVFGPRGQKRHIVGNSSLGLQLLYDYDDRLGGDLWELDAKSGVLTLNVHHPHFTMVDIKDSTLMKFQEHVAMQALHLHAMPESSRPLQRRFSDASMGSFCFWLLNADKLRLPKKDKES